MPIQIDTQIIHASIASVLNRIDPAAQIFDNPTQQGTPYPAWYIIHRSPVERQRECGNRYIIVYQIDIWYMLQQNITRLYDQYTEVAERLQEEIEYLPIYGHDSVLIHTYENSWGLELNAMKYSLTLRLRCSRSTTPDIKMAVIEDLQVFLKGLGKLKHVRYECPQFPDFDMGIETLQYCPEGDSVVLPFVSGIYRDGDNTRWEPISWNVGPFGGQYGPITDDMTVNLVMGVIVGFDVVVGGTVGVGENLGNDVVWRIVDMTRDSYRVAGPDRELASMPMLGGDDVSRDMYEPVGPQKSLGPSPVFGGTVEPYNPGPEIKIGYLGAGGTGVTFSSYGFETRSLWSGDSRIFYDRTKTYTLVSVHGYGGATDSVTNWSLTSGTNNSLALRRNISAGYAVHYAEYTES